MIWIIASLPFWIISAVLAGTAIFGLARLTREQTQEGFSDLAGGCLVILIGSGLFAIVAAKICS